MNIDLGSFAFGSYLQVGGGNPSWGTALGQSSPEYKITRNGSDRILIGMLYCAIPTKLVKMPMGKGGHYYSGEESTEIQMAALFENVYVNNTKIDYPFILVLQKEDSTSHSGRRNLKYSDKISYQYGHIVYSNEIFIQKVRKSLVLTEDACWFAYDIDVEGQNILHIKIVVVNKNESVEYSNSEERKHKWLDLISKEEDKQYNNGNIIVGALKDLQVIYFGCPGTGKSYKVKGIVENHKDFTFRTTFHPDYDYAAFVGCYKPVKESIDEHKTKRIDEAQIKSDLESILSSSNEKVNDICSYTAKYIESFLSIESFNKFMDTVEGAASYKTPISYILKAYSAMRKNDAKDVGTINYTFIPQVFTNAYVTAWLNPEEKIFLVIEEINRGNCAQIFGDLFQLLDRNSYGNSEYSVKADTDLCKYLEGILGKDSEGIKNGGLKLPSNLHILATMNTSDQSLFPMDSAFKRRWSWEYIPIDANCPDSQFKITIGAKTYSWASFLTLVNKRIHDLSDSEDKQMGNFFIKGNIDVEEFKSKVMFYLWNEVCKEYEHAGSFFKYKGTDGKDVEFTFNELFPTNESTNAILQGFMTYLGMEKATTEATE